MKYLVGLSGGLDSASAAKRLLEKGETVEGVYLKMFASSDPSAARTTAEELGIPFQVLDCTDIFERCVLKQFEDSYCRGLTPNPCVECNRYVKIQTLCDYCEEKGFDKVVTGHYGAVVKTEEGRYCVKRSKNEKKDQSYMLWGLTQQQLSKMELPLYAEDKEKLRSEAKECGMISAMAKESMDICFLPQGGYAEFIIGRRGECPRGEFVNESGKVLGEHKGIIHYTVGQRKHLGIALGEPMYISDINPENNRITLVKAGGEYGMSARVGRLNFQAMAPTKSGEIDGLTVKTRYAQKPMPVKVRFDRKGATVTFFEPARAITPGQSAVFYKEDRVAFGGYIEKI